MVIRGIAFDLDDTLYPEADYVRSGFAAVAAAVGATPDERGALHQWLMDALQSGVRGDTFDRLRARFPDVAARVPTRGLVELYRGHGPNIALSDDVVGTLTTLATVGVRMGIVTDGPEASQAAKVRALGLDRWFAPIILTETLGQGFGKPNTAAFEAIADAWQLSSDELAYVGDNPCKDFTGPRRLGWRTIRVRWSGQLHALAEPLSPADAPDLEIDHVRDLTGRIGLAV